MIDEILYMNGYGFYVWSSFAFTIISFSFLYLVVKFELVQEQKKFKLKYNSLDEEKLTSASKQETYREILRKTTISKI
tara:strand:+ start:311 stop:544 length:234 start_codon:yes stop_codon:yes gene_type:complete